MATSPALLLAGLALLLAAQAQPPSSMRPIPELLGERATPRRECPANCTPNRSGAPRKNVCGSDGKTYASACHLRRQQCQHPISNLKLNYRGKCRPNRLSGQPNTNLRSSHASTACQEARKFHVSKESESKFVPKCDKDGNFATMQCFKVYCWCVEPISGNPIMNTYLENIKPDCSKVRRKDAPPLIRQPKEPIRKRPTSQPGIIVGGKLAPRKPKKVCDDLDRFTFNKNLLDSIIVDMRHLPIADRTDDLGEIIMEKTNNPDKQRRILELKFNSMDENQDEILEKREYRGLRKFARTTVIPRRCSRTFIQRCDRNKDTKISKDEWLKCLGFNTQRVVEPEVPLNEDEPPIDMESSSSSEQDSAEGRGCLLDRKSALEQPGNTYVPLCTDDGKYQRAQCYSSTGYCFCVEEETGKMIDGSVVMKSNPQCGPRQASSSGSSRAIHKCPEEKKRRFITEFKALMGAKVDFSEWKGGENADDEKSKYEKIVAASFFQNLDKNSDRALDKREWKEFRNIVEERASLKQCGKKFLRYCDSNEDGRVTYSEWESCLTISKTPQSFEEGIIGATHNPNRTGKNPLDQLLE